MTLKNVKDQIEQKVLGNKLKRALDTENIETEIRSQCNDKVVVPIREEVESIISVKENIIDEQFSDE